MRVARIVLIVAVVLGGLFVAADRISVSVAQHKAAERAQVTENLTERPKVSISGFPFLTQVISGKLDDVKVAADDIAAGDGSQSLRIDTFRADLYGVKLSNGFSHAVADSADGQAFITYADLTKAAPAGIKVSYAGPSSSGTPRVKLTGSFLGAHLSLLSDVVLGKDSIGLHAEGLPKELTALGLEGKVRAQIDFSRQVTHLPANLQLTSVTTTPDGMSVQVGGKGVVLAN